MNLLDAEGPEQKRKKNKALRIQKIDQYQIIYLCYAAPKLFDADVIFWMRRTLFFSFLPRPFSFYELHI